MVRTSFGPPTGLAVGLTPGDHANGTRVNRALRSYQRPIRPIRDVSGAPAVGPPLASIHGDDSARVEQLFVMLCALCRLLCDDHHTSSSSAEVRDATISPVAKVEMRVIPEPAEGTRHVLTAEKHPGSTAIKGTEGSMTFLCGGCRAVLAKNVGPDDAIVYTEDPQTGDFTPLYRVRDLVFKCKGCGAFNDVARSDPRK